MKLPARAVGIIIMMTPAATASSADMRLDSAYSAIPTADASASSSVVMPSAARKMAGSINMIDNCMIRTTYVFRSVVFWSGAGLLLFSALPVGELRDTATFTVTIAENYL